MPWYAVARGSEPGVYKTWDECKERTDNFSGAKYRKFQTQGEAIAFVNDHGKNNLKKQIEVNKNYTMTRELSPLKAQTSSPSFSSPKLKANALKQRLAAIENLYENSMLELRLEIDSIKERIENFSVIANIPNDATEQTENFKSLQETLSKLTESYKKSVEELKKEITDLRCSLESLETELEQIKTDSDKLPYNSGVSSFKRNLFKEAVIPTAVKRSYSSTANETSKSKKKKIKTADDGNNPVVINIDSDDSSGFEVDDKGYVQVYTDGACEKNGKIGARAGVGVYFGDHHPLNYSEPVRGRQTNNTAEIQAATCAIDLARKAGIKKLVINTDSEFLISCITVWIHKWKRNDWKLANGESVKNKEDLIELEEALDGMNVRWNHVRGHRGVHGNEMADALARAGAKKKR